MTHIPHPPADRILDIECYVNYVLLAFRRVDNATPALRFEARDGAPFTPEQIAEVQQVLAVSRIYTFNGRGYDIPVLTFAMLGYATHALKQIGDQIIQQGMKPWDLEKMYGIAMLDLDHVDLMEVAPGQGSLKIYAGRLHSRRLQDLPIAPEAVTTVEDQRDLADYCVNSDCVATIDLRNALAPQLALRDAMSAEYGLDLRSKSDAQIAESVIRKQVEALLGRRVYRPEIPPGTRFQYRPPEWLHYGTQHMRDVLAKVCGAWFTVASNGSVEMPPELDDYAVPIGRGVYRMGIGGLHSSEKCVSYEAGEDYLLIDRDVASYYPAIILNCGLYPRHLGTEFLQVYRGIVQRRLSAKRAGDKVTADSLKITINGSFGKLGSMWSVLYSPDLMIQVTITGQLALMMLIEALELSGIQVVSANTDGIVIRAHRSQYDHLNALVAWWEACTGFETEESRYRALYSRDVNNYVAIKAKGGVKTKGAFNTGEVPLAKNPVNNVCLDAVVAYLEHGVPIEATILGCADIRKFVTLRKVQGGGKWGDKYLGKTVRWVYSTQGAPITYVTSGNRVARSEGAFPVMDLPDVPPDHLDYGWYVTEARSILKDLGVNYVS